MRGALASMSLALLLGCAACGKSGTNAAPTVSPPNDAAPAHSACATVTTPGRMLEKSDLARGCELDDGSRYTFSTLGDSCLAWIDQDGLSRWAQVGSTWQVSSGVLADDPRYKAAYAGCNT
jgi:hypothetical protein